MTSRTKYLRKSPKVLPVASLFLVASLLLTACGAAEAPQAPAAAEQPAAAAPVEGDAAAPAAGAAAPAAGGLLAADNGFRPEVHGFPFPNYGADPSITNLTPADLRRLFGDVVCARIDGDTCVLTPPGEQWMQMANKAMNGGHCEGFAIASTLMYNGKLNASSFGGEKGASLTIAGNEALQREIALWFITQGTPPSGGTERKDMTPSQVVDELIAQFARGADQEYYVLGIYQPGYKGGHAVTPYAIREEADGTTSILVYDNNYPLVERVIKVDRKAETWQYQASTNPSEAASLYQGDAGSGTLTLAPISIRLEPQICPFCDQPAQATTGSSRLAAPAPEYNELWQYGDVNVLITDGEGRRLGFVDGKLVSEIPGAMLAPIKGGLWDDDTAPVWRIPTGISFTVALNGQGLDGEEMTDLALVGPGYTLAVEGIMFNEGQEDSIVFSPDGRRLIYKTNAADTPLLTVGVENDAADYEFEVSVIGDQDGQEVELILDPEKSSLAITTAGRDESATYDLVMTRYGEDDEQTFEATEMVLAAGATDYVRYGEWTGQGSSLKVEFDLDDDGTIDETVEVNDAK